MTSGKSHSAPSFRFILLVLMGLVIVYMGVGFVRQAGIRHQRQEELHRIERQLQATQQDILLLEERLVYAQSPEAVEQWARENGWAREDEVSVVVVAPPSAPLAGERGVPGDQTPPSTNRDSWWELFFGEY
jgi:hypothetical protein